jgi:hypothetical protein
MMVIFRKASVVDIRRLKSFDDRQAAGDEHRERDSNR